MNEWRKVKLGEIIDTISDTEKIKKDKVVLINTSDILEGKVLNHNYSDNLNLKGQFKKRFKKFDILYSEIRPNNKRFAKINFDSDDYIASTKIMVLRKKEKIQINFDYIYLYLTSNNTIEKLQAIAEGRSGTFPQITFNEIKSLEILLPPINLQDKITKILSDIDKKMELNNKINNNLEEQCITIFKKMFPQIFYGSFNVGNYLKPKRGKNLLSKNAILGDIPVVAGGLEPAIYHNKSNTQSPVITISASGANAGFIRLWHTPVWSSDSSYIDYSVSKYIYFWYLFLKLRQKEIYDLQSGSAQPHIYPKHLEELSINKLDIKLIETFDEITSNFFEKIGKNNTENNKLTNLKNYLLPKLMNGEIDVENIEL